MHRKVTISVLCNPGVSYMAVRSKLYYGWTAWLNMPKPYLTPVMTTEMSLIRFACNLQYYIKRNEVLMTDAYIKITYLEI